MFFYLSCTALCSIVVLLRCLTNKVGFDWIGNNPAGYIGVLLGIHVTPPPTMTTSVLLVQDKKSEQCIEHLIL